MDILPAGIAAQQAITKQNVALNVIKQSADADKAVAGILQQSADNIAAQTGRGTNVNIRV